MLLFSCEIHMQKIANTCMSNNLPAAKGFKQFQQQTKAFPDESIARFTQNTPNRHCRAGQEKWSAKFIFMKVHPFTVLTYHLV